MHPTATVVRAEMQVLNPATVWPVVGLVLAAAIIDIRSRRIPNRLVLPFLVLGIGVAVLLSGWSGVVHSLAGVLLAIIAVGPFCALGGMGMGDLKLCAAVGAWIGASQLVAALVMTGLIGAVMAVAWALAGGFLSDALRDTAALISGHRKRRTLADPAVRKMPYAPAIAIGTILSFFGRHL